MSREKYRKSVYAFRGTIIREARKQKRWTQKDLASALGVAQSRISEWERGLGSPSIEDYLVLTGEHGFDLAWLLSGKAQKSLEVDGLPQPIVAFSTAGAAPEVVNTAHYLAVPLLSDPVAAGEPLVNTDEVEEWAWIHVSQIGKRKNLVAIRIKGDSMNPLIRDGDIVAIDRHDWKPPGIFAVRCDTDGVTVKRVKQIGDHALLLVPENRDYDERLVTLAKGQMLRDVVIGRAVWQWSDLTGIK
jgi:repressor LexA